MNEQQNNDLPGMMHIAIGDHGTPDSRPSSWPYPSLDARIWTEEFLKRNKLQDNDDAEATMIGWFANAIMAGYDGAVRNLDALAEQVNRPQLPSGIAWIKLRRKFFDECTDPVSDNPGIRKINMAPHDLLEWLKDAVAECREFVMLPQLPSFADMVREKLKPLEWEKDYSGYWAGSIFGPYYLRPHIACGFWLFRHTMEQRKKTAHITLDEAKAAAQEHYTSKVLELFDTTNQ